MQIAQLLDFELALSYFEDIGAAAADKFRSLAVFDSIIANTDRHVGNFGVLRDNATGEILDIAPIFDNNVSLFTRDLDEQLELDSMLDRIEHAPGILDATLGWQGSALLGETQRAQVARLADFEFEGAGFIDERWAVCPDPTRSISPARLDALGRFIRARGAALLG